MSTFMAKMGGTQRKWYVIDAAGKPMGKTAVFLRNFKKNFYIFYFLLITLEYF